MGMWANRDGKTYAHGDPGFWEAWEANMREWANEWIARAYERHLERLKTDPAYRAKEKALEAEYDRVFNQEVK